MRNSSRQTRTNPTRTSRVLGSSLRQNSLVSNPAPILPEANEPAGFYPAITHFTDAITALPRDYRRHTSLLKEVDAKAWAPEENLQKLLQTCFAATPSREETTNSTSANASVAGSILGGPDDIPGIAPDNTSVHSAATTDITRAARRELFGNLRHTLMVMMVTMDEKNHVINNANEELSRHLRRLNGSYPAIADEVSEEARLGSLKHWAYFETNPIRRGGTHLDRRQAAASLAALHATEAAERSEHRREAVLAKKARLNQIDSDFDENRPAPKRPQANGRNRRIGELTAENAGLGPSGAAGGKRKKPEKAAAGNTNGERSLAAVGVGGRAMSREPSQQEQKKRKAPTSNPAGTAPARKRYKILNTFPLIRLTSSSRANLGAQDSPKLISSPLAGAFSKDAHKRSPVPGFARPASARARQNSTQANDTAQARPASSTSRKHTNGNGVTAATPELNSVAAMTGKSAADVKNTMKESTNQKGDRLIEDGGTDINGNSMRGGILLQRSSSKASLKREANASEETVGKASPRIPPPIITDIKTDRSNRAVRASKTSTPVMGSFAESPDPADGTNGDVTNGNATKPKRVSRPRMKDHGLHDSLSPKALPPKRSHKKGAGLLAQANASAQSLRNIGASSDSLNGGGVDEAGGAEELMSEDEADGDEASDERYCYCNDISYGEMVACDNKNCAREWFHLRCVGLEKAPGKNAKWFCDECKEVLGMRRDGGGNVKGRGASVSVSGGGK
jgi:hypothetical protein